MSESTVGTLFSYVKNVGLRAIGLTREMDSGYYVEHARRKGVEIGQGTRFYGAKKLDLGHGPLISIGSHCKITDGVRILAHSGDHEILRRAFDSERPSMPFLSPVDIGDNVFIGEQSIVLPGVTIGDNTVIGAGSVVSSDIPGNSVAAGNPCEVIEDLSELYETEIDEEAANTETYFRRFDKRGVEPHLPEPDFSELNESVEGDPDAE